MGKLCTVSLRILWLWWSSKDITHQGASGCKNSEHVLWDMQQEELGSSHNLERSFLFPTAVVSYPFAEHASDFMNSRVWSWALASLALKAVNKNISSHSNVRP